MKPVFFVFEQEHVTKKNIFVYLLFLVQIYKRNKKKRHEKKEVETKFCPECQIENAFHKN